MHRLASPSSLARRLWRDRRAGVSVIGALSLTALLGMTGLAVEAGQGYAVKVANQRVADAAALAAALAYTARPDADLQKAAQSIALANGIAATDVTTQGPVKDGDRNLITVTIATTVPLHLTRVVTSALGYTVRASGIAAVGSGGDAGSGGGTGCILALSTTAPTGIAMSGGTWIDAPGCAIAANGPIGLDGGAKVLNAEQVRSGGAITRGGGASITTQPADHIYPNKPGAAGDPLAANKDLDNALAKLDAMPVVTPSGPAGENWDFNYNPAPNVAGYRTSQWGSEYVVPPGQYRIGRLTIQGGLTVTFKGGRTSDGQDSSITIYNGLDNGGNSLTIGDGALTIFGTASFNSTTTTIGSGSHAFETIQLGGGKTLTIGDGAFISKDINTSGGSRISFGAAGNHYVRGTLNLAGAAQFGAGAYTIKGDFTNTVGCGNCAMQGTNVSFFLSGAVTLGGGSGLDVSAPDAKVGEALPGILFATRAATANRLIQGTNIRLGGVWWSPNAPFSMEGGARVVGTGRCFSLVTATVTLAGGTSITAAPCAAIAGDGDGPGKIALIR